MSKVMLVEDDNNLREIYEARLQAEGYTIVSAKDGEEALVLAKAEKPDLIISDIMMPKISGFEMLDILRNTDGLKDVKIIMLTALGQNDDQQRADRLGADRYLVKSQVTLEDIIKAAHELLGDKPAAATAPEATATPPSPSAPAPAAAASSSTQATAPTTIAVAAEPSDSPVPAAPAQSTAQEESAVDSQIEDFVAGATQDATPPAPAAATTTDSSAPAKPAATSSTDSASDDKLVSDAAQSLVDSTATPPAPASTAPAPEPPAQETPAEPSPGGSVPIAHKKVITPLDDEPKKDLDSLLAAEAAKEASVGPASSAAAPVVVSSDQPSGAPPADKGTSPSSPSQPVDPNSIAL